MRERPILFGAPMVRATLDLCKEPPKPGGSVEKFQAVQAAWETYGKEMIRE